MSLTKKKSELHKLEFTDNDIIELAGQNYVMMLKYPSLSFYSEWIQAGVEQNTEKIDELLRQLLKNDDGTDLLAHDEIIELDVYEHIIILITNYLLKQKTKRLTQKDPTQELNT